MMAEQIAHCDAVGRDGVMQPEFRDVIRTGFFQGDSASVQAVTRVNAEQASKRTMRRPTRQPFRGRLIWLGERAKRPGALGWRRGPQYR
jgi:hypothetical protein